MADRKLRVALIGAGFMGKAHSNAYAQVGHFFDVPFGIERKVICARDRARLDKMAATWGWAETGTDWRAVVQRKDIDLVDVAVPNALHAPIAIAAAGAGKMVLCEKPLAVSGAEAACMAEAARNLPTMVWYNYRRVPAVAFARQLIDADRIGRVFHYRATYLQQSGNDPTRPPSWKTEKAQAGSGVIGDLLSHLVDTALYLNGPITEVTALARTFAPGRDVDDACILLARFENGSIGTFEATRFGVGCRNRNAFEMNGARGMLGFDLEDLNRLEFLDATEPRNTQGGRNLLVTGPDQPYSGNFWKPGHVIGYEHTFIAALADFLRALASGDDFHPNFEDGLRVQLLLDAVERSAQSRAWEKPEVR
jgi:myo-inositol 2-dehydrogenase/D-chiro-inositol 1-dehydrogenase